MKELLEIYDIIEVKYPLYQEKTNLSRYAIKDNFLSFRFKYVYANKELFAL
ncbi:MAG: hypothetical protein LBU27_09425 [Candidatus Peribacteria bacterium]|nr:hypothetical protein [Candidatus Peribacteria bacterium]